MIVEGLLSFLFGVGEFLVGLFPDSAAPAWLSDGAGYVSDIFAMAGGLSGWFPFSLMGNVLTAVLACIAIGFAIKVVRLVVSLFSGGGGSAA